MLGSLKLDWSFKNSRREILTYFDVKDGNELCWCEGFIVERSDGTWPMVNNVLWHATCFTFGTCMIHDTSSSCSPCKVVSMACCIAGCVRGWMRWASTLNLCVGPLRIDMQPVHHVGFNSAMLGTTFDMDVTSASFIPEICQRFKLSLYSVFARRFSHTNFGSPSHKLYHIVDFNVHSLFLCLAHRGTE